MTDLEYTILDELYFVCSFEQLVHKVNFPPSEIIAVLENMYQNGWVRLTHPESGEIPPPEFSISEKPDMYYYLATKQGLFAHNSV